MKIHFGTDHAGYNLKETLKSFVASLGHEPIDHGAFSLDPNDDYPTFISSAAKAVSQDLDSKGIILGGSGQGEAMDANRFEHVRACEYYGGDVAIVKTSRQHNDANVLSLGARFITEDEAKSVVQVFLETPLSNEERHERRIAELN